MQKNQNKMLIRTKESKNTISLLVCYAGMHSVLHIIITAYIHNTYYIQYILMCANLIVICILVTELLRINQDKGLIYSNKRNVHICSTICYISIHINRQLCMYLKISKYIRIQEEYSSFIQNCLVFLNHARII